MTAVWPWYSNNLCICIPGVESVNFLPKRTVIVSVWDFKVDFGIIYCIYFVFLEIRCLHWVISVVVELPNIAVQWSTCK